MGTSVFELGAKLGTIVLENSLLLLERLFRERVGQDAPLSIMCLPVCGEDICNDYINTHAPGTAGQVDLNLLCTPLGVVSMKFGSFAISTDRCP